MKEAVWDIILSNESAFRRILVEWRWLWVLPQVCRTFAEVLRPLRTQWMWVMCEEDQRRSIWRSKARELFGLSVAELEPLPYTGVRSKSQRWRYTHLMDRPLVLEAARTRNGPLFTDIAAAFEERKMRPKRPLIR